MSSIGGSSPLALGGLISGVNVDDIIQKLQQIQAQQVKTIQDREAQVLSKQTAWGEVKGSLGALRSALDGIRLASAFQAKLATVGDTTVATATASVGAIPTTHSLSVYSLAQSDVVSSGGFATANTALGFTKGQFRIGRFAIAVDPTDTLNSLRDKINGIAGIGATAAVQQVTNNGVTTSRLVLTANKSGIAGALNIGMLSSDHLDIVDPSASTSPTGAPSSVQVSQLAMWSGASTSANLPVANHYTGSFTIQNKNGVSHTFDFTSANNGQGATVDDVVKAINGYAAQDGTFGVTATANPDTSNPPQTKGITISATNGFAFTADSGILSQLGLVGSSSDSKVISLDPTTPTGAPIQQAKFSLDGGTTWITQNSNTYTSGGTVLNLTGTGTANLGTLPEQLGFRDATSPSGAYKTQLAAAANATGVLDGIQFSEQTNTLSTVIPNLTLNLLMTNATPTNGDPTNPSKSTTVTVANDNGGITQHVQDWVDALNGTLALLKKDTAYDAGSKTAGPLNGDTIATGLYNQLRSMLSNVVTGLPENLNTLSDIGITTGAWGTDNYGKILLDSSKLSQQLSADPTTVAKIFGAMRQNVALAGNGGRVEASATASGNYSKDDVMNGDTSSDRFGTVGGGWQSLNVPSDTSPVYLMSAFSGPKWIDEAQLWMPDTPDHPASKEGLKNYVLQYTNDAAPDMLNGHWTDLQTVTDGNVGYNAMDFTAVQATAVRLKITGTNGSAPARVTELQVNEQSNGPALSMYNYIGSALGIKGTVTSHLSTYDEQVKAMESQITNLNDSMAKQEQTLRDQFNQMEQAVSQLRTQGNALLAQLGMGGQSQG